MTKKKTNGFNYEYKPSPYTPSQAELDEANYICDLTFRRIEGKELSPAQKAYLDTLDRRINSMSDTGWRGSSIDRK
jgi:hypothetical protein